MRWLAAVQLLLLAACSRQAHVVRLPTDEPGVEVYSISCRGVAAQCREKADELCTTGYEVLRSSGVSTEPPRVSSAPGPRSTGSRSQRPDWSGELVIACGSAAPAPARDAATAPPAPPAPALAPDQLCIPGTTQLCLGPAACRGAQACLADGRGYGVCDCGSAPARDAGTGAPAGGL